MSEKQKKSKGNGKPWQPGQSGNPKGRPKKDCSLTSLLKEELDKVPELKDKSGATNTKTWRQLLVQAWLLGAMKKSDLLKELLDRVEGKVAQPISGDKDNPIAMSVQISVVSDTSKKLTEDILQGKGT